MLQVSDRRKSYEYETIKRWEGKRDARDYDVESSLWQTFGGSSAIYVLLLMFVEIWLVWFQLLLFLHKGFCWAWFRLSFNAHENIIKQELLGRPDSIAKSVIVQNSSANKTHKSEASTERKLFVLVRSIRDEKPFHAGKLTHTWGTIVWSETWNFTTWIHILEQHFWCLGVNNFCRIPCLTLVYWPTCMIALLELNEARFLRLKDLLAFDYYVTILKLWDEH